MIDWDVIRTLGLGSTAMIAAAFSGRKLKDLCSRISLSLSTWRRVQIVLFVGLVIFVQFLIFVALIGSFPRGEIGQSGRMDIALGFAVGVVLGYSVFALFDDRNE